MQPFVERGADVAGWLPRLDRGQNGGTWAQPNSVRPAPIGRCAGGRKRPSIATPTGETLRISTRSSLTNYAPRPTGCRRGRIVNSDSRSVADRPEQPNGTPTTSGGWPRPGFRKHGLRRPPHPSSSPCRRFFRRIVGHAFARPRSDESSDESLRRIRRRGFRRIFRRIAAPNSPAALQRIFRRIVDTGSAGRGGLSGLASGSGAVASFHST